MLSAIKRAKVWAKSFYFFNFVASREICFIVSSRAEQSLFAEKGRFLWRGVCFERAKEKGDQIIHLILFRSQDAQN